MNKKDLLTQIEEVKEIMNEVETTKDFINFAKISNEIYGHEINYNPISEYDGENVEVYRIEYKNLMVYFDDKFNPDLNNITVYDTEGGYEVYNGNLQEISENFQCN